MQFTELWPGGPKYSNSGRAFPLTADSIILADFAPRNPRVLDIGCGSGIIGLLIAWNNADAHVTGIDISREAIECARRNVAQNSLDGRFCAVHGDIMDTELLKSAFDLAVCNPPYFEKGRGKSAGAAREESTATLFDIIKRASALLVRGGSLCIVIRPDRLAEALSAMAELEFSPARLRTVTHTANSPPSMALVEARLGAGSHLKVLPPLALKGENGGDSDEIKRIYRMN